jgi:hypothetical protein
MRARRSQPSLARPPAANRRRKTMSQETRQQSGGQTSSSIDLDIVLWAMVLIPLAWGVYQTLTGVVALFTGG